MLKSPFVALAAFAFVCVIHTIPAQAASRAWVSGIGTDQAGCGPFPSPCRTLQYAHDNIVDAGGEIDILDPAGYGSIAISKAISIVNDGVGTAGMLAADGGNAITIHANPGDAIQLRGLTIEGLVSGFNGIEFDSGGSLTVTNCVVQNFTGNGIVIQPTAGTVSFAITNTVASNNLGNGIAYFPPGGASANGVIDHVVATGSNTGILLDTQGTAATLAAVISNSIASNGFYGMEINNGTGTMTVSIDNVTVSGNSNLGIYAFGTVNVLLGRSVIMGNSDNGIYNSTAPNTFYTYKNNRINFNGNSNMIGGDGALTAFSLK